jgi:hypothetical protein
LFNSQSQKTIKIEKEKLKDCRWFVAFNTMSLVSAIAILLLLAFHLSGALDEDFKTSMMTTRHADFR